MTDIASGERMIDFSALTEPVPRAEIEAFSVRMADKPEFRWSFGGWVASIVALSIASAFFLLCTGVFVALIATGGWVESKPSTLFGAFFGIAVCGGLAALPLYFLVQTIRRRSRLEAWYRMLNFGEDNDLVFSRTDLSPEFPGTVFQPGGGYFPQLVDHFTGPDDEFTYGNMFTETRAKKKSATEETGFLAVKLERRLPHMVLKSHHQRLGIGGLPADFRKDQTLSLEGDFDKYFTLYCPAEYETDALYVFTPDLMALMIDEARRFDIEIVDDWMLAYPGGWLDLTRPAANQTLLRIADLVGSKAQGRSRYYRDERVGEFAANRIASTGRRLRRRIGTISLTIFIVVVLSSPFWGLIAEAVLDR